MSIDKDARDFVRSDKDAQKFLRAVLENDGEATTTEIRERTGLTKGKVTYRFDKLESGGWIEVDKASDGYGDRTPPKIAILTDEGYNEIKKGNAGEYVLREDEEEDKEIVVDEEMLREFQDEIDAIKGRLNVIVEKVNGRHGEPDDSYEENNTVSSDKYEEITSRIDELERMIDLIRTTVQDIKNSESQTEGQITDGNLTDDQVEMLNKVQDTQEYLEDWMDVAQVNITAMRMYMLDNFDDFEDYIDRAKEQQQ